MSPIKITCRVAASLALVQISLAQSPTSSSLSGRVLSEQGLPLHANVVLSFSTPRGYPIPPRRVRTDATGAFTFTRLDAGTYALCAQVAASEAAPPNSPYVDTCVWGSGQAPIKLSTGQQLTGVVFTAPKGTWLKVHVYDPESALPQPLAKGPAPLEPELQLILKGPDGLFRHAQFISLDSSGRNYQSAVPLKTALTLRVTSSVAAVFDQNGKQQKDTDESAFQPTTPADLTPMNFTLHRK